MAERVTEAVSSWRAEECRIEKYASWEERFQKVAQHAERELLPYISIQMPQPSSMVEQTAEAKALKRRYANFQRREDRCEDMGNEKFRLTREEQWQIT